MTFDEIKEVANAHKQVRDRKTARDVRRRAGITLSQMAKLLGVSESSMCRYEDGTRQPRAEVAIRWANALVELDRINESTAA